MHIRLFPLLLLCALGIALNSCLKKQWNSDLAIIWDVSLSGLQRNLEQEMEALNIIFSENKDASVNLYFLNNKLNSKGKYKVTNGNWSSLKNALNTAVFDGGTDFSKINLNEIIGNEILFFSDGISTLSDADFIKNTKSNRPIHSIVSYAKSDSSTMKFIAGKTNGKFININALSPEKLKSEVHKIWAQKKINKLGNQFGIVTRNTSEPQLPVEYEYPSWLKKDEEILRSVERNIFNDAVAAAEKIKKWWDTDFTHQTTKYKYPIPTSDKVYDEIIKVLEELLNIDSAKASNDYLSKFTGKTTEDYQAYLQLRNDYYNDPSFYFDMSNWFYTHGDKETALRILTSIADLELEKASLYRLLGYKFKEYGEYELEKFVFQKVVQWRPMELQSYRDYALALADNGEDQAALDSLHSLLTRTHSVKIGLFNSGIEEVVVTEINNLISRNSSLDISKIDKRLIVNIPVDIRIVINWNMGNNDVGLYVIDPNNEEVSSYWRREAKIGEHISDNITSGYGPKQFLLKKAVKGKYKVYVNYFSYKQFSSVGPLTIMAEIFTKYSDETEQRQVVSLQMSKNKYGKVEVAEISF